MTGLKLKKTVIVAIGASLTSILILGLVLFLNYSHDFSSQKNQTLLENPDEIKDITHLLARKQTRDEALKRKSAKSIGGDFRLDSTEKHGVLFIGHAYGAIDNKRVPYRPLEFFLDKFFNAEHISEIVFLGDITRVPEDLPIFLDFIEKYPAKKIYVAGNHDNNLHLFSSVNETSVLNIGNITAKTINFKSHTELLLHNPEEIFRQPYKMYLSHYGIFHPLLPSRPWKDRFKDYVKLHPDLFSTFHENPMGNPEGLSIADWGKRHYEENGQYENRKLHDPTIEKGFNNIDGFPIQYLEHLFHPIFALKDRIFVAGDCGAGVRESKPYIFEVVERKILLCTGMGDGGSEDNVIFMNNNSMKFIFFDATGNVVNEKFIYDRSNPDDNA